MGGRGCHAGSEEGAHQYKAHNGHPEGEEQSSPVLRSRIERVCQAEKFISMSEK